MGRQRWNFGEDAGAPFHFQTLTPVPTITVAAYRIVNLRSMSASPHPDPTVAHSVALPTGYPTDMTEFSPLQKGQSFIIPKLSWQVRIRGTEVLEQTGYLNIHATLWQVQLQWSGHLVRMDNERLPKKLLYNTTMTTTLTTSDHFAETPPASNTGTILSCNPRVSHSDHHWHHFPTPTANETTSNYTQTATFTFTTTPNYEGWKLGSNLSSLR
ncbi:unnamed protein product [Schistocephalus solidus]|uniref:Plastocyanin-like domain-containing protein n=1 Tax=Schistocephalus solidus TaxID=70667 RepID=A0A183SIV0_SCHSO|nr:unnamed protein product [Schistocephalus solidus]